MNNTEGSKVCLSSVSDSITRTLMSESSSDEEVKKLQKVSSSGRLFTLITEDRDPDIIKITSLSCFQPLSQIEEGKEIFHSTPLSQPLKACANEFEKDKGFDPQSSDGKKRKKANSTGTRDRTKSAEGVDGLVNTKKMKRHTAEAITDVQSDTKPSNMVIPSPNVSLGLMLKISCSLSLRSIHTCLNYTTGFNQCSFQWIKDYGLAVCFEEKKLREKNEEAFEKIHEVINRALSVKISHFSDRQGKEVLLQDLIKRLMKNCSDLENQIPKDFLNKIILLSQKADLLNENMQLETMKDASKYCMLSPLPKELTKPECFSSTLLTRLFSCEITPESKNAGLVHPITLICNYRRWVSTEQLFSQILEKVSLPEESMPMPQKLEIMNLIRLWLNCGLNFKEEERTQVSIAFRSILLRTKTVKDERFLSIAEEVFQILQNPLKESQLTRVEQGKLQFETLIGNLWGCKDQKVNLTFISAELHKCFIHYFLSFESHELIYGLDKKDSPQKVPSLCNLVSFFNKLTSYTRTTILGPAEELEHVKEVNEKVRVVVLEKVRERYLFFIDLAYEMVKLRNFSACIAIVLGVSCPAISKLFLKTTVTYDNEGKRVTKEIRSSKKIHKSSIVKLEEMNRIFTPVKSNDALRQEYRKTNASYIPYPGMTLKDTTFIEDGNKDLVEGAFPINIEKLELFANSLLPVIESQRRLFFELQCQGSCIQMESDLFSFLNSCQFYEENKLYLLSGKVKGNG